MTEIKVAEIVRSTAGHDSGRLYVVVSLSGAYALLADGKTRRLDRPKRKKLRHLLPEADTPAAVGEHVTRGTVTDSELRSVLAQWKSTVQIEKRRV